MYEKDQILVQKIVSGDEEAFNEFYNAYFQKVYNFIYLKVRDHSATEDLTQEAFIAFVDSLAIFEGKSSLLCWIFSISKNTVHNWFRKKKRDLCVLEKSENSLLENFHVDTSTPLSDLEYQEYLAMCNQRLQAVRPESREIFVKKHFLGLTIKEISEQTRKTPGAVKTDLYRTRMFLLKGKSAH